VYWWWEPRDARISFADVEPGSGGLPEGVDPGTAPPPSRVIPPSFTEYTIGADDTSLEDIARKFYGSPDQWRAIARATPLMSPSPLRAGRVIRIPADPGNVQGRVERSGASSPGAGPAEPTEYTVLDGDTLSSISQQFYGTTARARLIFEHNRERLRLKSLDSIRAGQTLVIPPAPPGG
jgi:nucleoid-associated protein YgaU